MSSHVENLTSLPNDVLAAITSDFDLADLCSLRLTSHNLHAIATTPDFEARFHHIRTGLSLANLQALVAICSSRDLGHLVKEITVLAKHYDDQELCKQLEDGTIWRADPGNGPVFSSSGHYMTDDEKAEAKAHAALQAAGTEIDLLSEAFKHLGPRAVDLSIEAAIHVRPRGPRLPIINCRDHEAMAQRMDHTFKATIAALSNSQLQISNLTVFEMQWGGYVSMKGLHEALQSTASPSPQYSSALSIPPALQRVRSLTLSLHAAPTKKIPKDQLDNSDDSKYPICHEPASPPALHIAYLRSLAALIHPLASTLNHLNIRFRGFHALKLDCAEIFSHLASPNITFPSLSTLNLHNIVIHNTDILSLLRATPSLTHLSFHKVSLPHNPAHPRKLVEYPNASPEWAQVEPDVSSWKDDWKLVFDVLASHSQHDVTNDIKAPAVPCPNLKTLEVNSIYLTSFEHRVYFTSPFTALKRYVHSIIDDEHKKKTEWFKIQAFQEGLPCCVFTGDEVRGEAGGDVVGEETSTAYKHPSLNNGLYIPLPPPPPSEPATASLADTGKISVAAPQGIQYKVSTTRPYGSPAYYQWLHCWEAREFGVRGCAPVLGQTSGK